MKDFKKGGGFKKSFGARPSFAPKTLHQATCSDCGTACEVPFRPSGGRPVFCRECFSKHAPESSRDGGFKQPFNKFENRGDRPPFSPRPTFAPRPHAAQDNEVTQQLVTLNQKLDRLIAVIEESAKKPAPKTAKKAAPKKK